MKIKPEHLEYLRAYITPLDTPARRKMYKGQTDKRYRWDLTYAAKLTQFICTTLYTYMNDDHIDTALRKIVPPLNEVTTIE